MPHKREEPLSSREPDLEPPQEDNRATGRDGSGLETGTPLPVTSDDEEPGTEMPPAFYVAGIGASAGGLEAFTELFEALPPDTGMAYVLVTHMPADQKSHLPDILTRHTPMPVVAIADGIRLEPDRVYVLPPSYRVRLERGVCRLDLLTDHPTRVIDDFFRSLAREHKSRAIGIVLSGMDGDGALGLRAIKGEGGITMVQSPGSARFPEMPQSSIAEDHVDIIQPPRALAQKLAQVAQQARTKHEGMFQGEFRTTDEERALARILVLMRTVSGVDFRLYKPATIRRRIARRMMLHRIDSMVEYLKKLTDDGTELRELQEDALINVTQFFRDPGVFESIKSLVLPRIFEHREPGEQVRVWVAGCSTGEEVYSIAMCLLEHVAGNELEPPIQIFGTDASERNIQRARAGIYPETIAAEVSPDRIRRFFAKVEKGYQVAKRVRDLCIFAQQNLCHDPPFSRIDLISCRNVLIYSGAELQRQLIPTFHYALRPEGSLLLGTSETIREFSDLFILLDRTHKIYAKVPSDSARVMVDVLPRVFPAERSAPQQPPSPGVWGDMELQRVTDRIVLARYGPPGVVVNAKLEILQTRGHTGPFLEMRPGTATLELTRMARESIAGAIIEAVRRAAEQDLPVQVPGLQVLDGGTVRETTLDVLPIHSLSHRAKCYLVLFAPPQGRQEPDRAEPVSSAAPGEDSDWLIAQLRNDLSSTKIYLQSLLEERDAKNQELVSANEEIQSANEELQSTNEELETTKEELQSSNEELHTVNDELQNRNAVLTRASNDLQNLLNNVNMPVLMLSNELHIRHFTPPTQRVMNLRSTDIDRPFGDIRLNLKVDDLTPLFQEVLDTLGARELEVQDRDGRWYLLRARPYRTVDNKIEGLVVVLVDIDQLRRSQQELVAARDFATSIIEGIPLPLAVVDAEFRIRATNEAFCALIGSTSQEVDRRLLTEVTRVLGGIERPLRIHLQSLRKVSPAGGSFHFEHQTTGESSRIFSIRGRALQPEGDQFLLVTIEDTTTTKEAERVLTAEKEGLAGEVASANLALGLSRGELRALTSRLFTTQEEERRRIARELHDDVIQRLAALEMESDDLQRAIPADAPLASSKLQQLRGRIETLSQDVRRMSHRLHPAILEDLGLAAALRSLTEDFDRAENMIATFLAREVPENIPMEVVTVLYRITQEALRNVAKHAGRTHVKVTLRGTDDGVELAVADAGHGFDQGEIRAGLGLVSMQERARMVGGTLRVQSELGRGTTVVVNVPLEEAG